jgi:hypothetical protein
LLHYPNWRYRKFALIPFLRIFADQSF